jgi:hypothetical protein
LAALITFAHFSVAPAMNLSKSAGKAIKRLNSHLAKQSREELVVYESSAG